MKTVELETNFNQKLACDLIVHVSQAPVQPVPECKLGQLYELKTKDNSHPPVTVELLFFMRFALGSSVDPYTLPSHNMGAADFIEWYKQQHPTAEYGTQMAVYYYRKA